MDDSSMVLMNDCRNFEGVFQDKCVRTIAGFYGPTTKYFYLGEGF